MLGIKLPNHLPDAPSIRRFNRTMERILLSLVPIALLVGFLSSTIAVFTSGMFVNTTLFTVMWAIAQAVSVDSMFFVVWYMVFHVQGKGLVTIFILLGVFYGLVAYIVNDIISFQELSTGLTAQAMLSLGFSPEVFTHIRSGLVILTAALYFFVEREVERIDKGKKRK